MVARIWAALGALVCGTVLATLPNGGMPMAGRIALLIALFVALAATLAARSRSRAHLPHAWDEPEAPPTRFSPAPQQSTIDDRRRPQPHPESVSPHVIDWLRTETFERPWRDDYARSLRRFDEAYATGDLALDHLRRQLADAAAAFLLVYDEFTVPDPLVVDGSWRMLPPGTEAERADASDPEQTRVQAKLIAAGRVVCKAYDSLAAAQTAGFSMRR